MAVREANGGAGRDAWGRKRVGVIAGGPFASVGWPPDLLELAGATFDKGKLVERVDTDDPTNTEEAAA